MKRVAFFTAILISIPLILVSSVFAQQIEQKDDIVVLKDQVINKDYFAKGQQISVLGSINGDAYLAGGKVTIEGNIGGDLIAVGGTINVRGRVVKNLRVAGGQVVISGEVGGNTTVAGGAVEIMDNAKIGGSLTSLAGSLTVYAPVSKGATIAAGDTTIASHINGDVVAAVGNISLTPQASVLGDLTYYSQNDAQIREGASINGKTTHNIPRIKQTQKYQGIGEKAKISLTIISLLLSLIIGAVLLRLLPVFSQKTVDRVLTKPLLSFGQGILALIVTPIAAILLAITLIGIPFALIMTVAFIIYLYIAKIFVALAVGQKLLELTQSKYGPIWALLAGLLIYAIISIIPIIGPLTAFIVVTIGVGAILQTKLTVYKLIRDKKLI